MEKKEEFFETENVGNMPTSREPKEGANFKAKFTRTVINCCRFPKNDNEATTFLLTLNKGVPYYRKDENGSRIFDSNCKQVFVTYTVIDATFSNSVYGWTAAKDAEPNGAIPYVFVNNNLKGKEIDLIISGYSKGSKYIKNGEEFENEQNGAAVLDLTIN